MAGEGIPLSRKQEGAFEEDEQSPQEEVITFADGNEGHLTWFPDGTLKVVEKDSTGKVVGVTKYGKEDAARYRQTLDEVNQQLGQPTILEADLLAPVDKNQPEPLSPLVELPEGGNAQIVRETETGVFVVHIVNPDGSVEDKNVVGNDLKEFGLPNPNAEAVADKADKVTVSGNGHAKDGESVPVRKLDKSYERPVGPEADQIQQDIDILTAQISRVGVAIGDARRDGKDADVERLTEEHQKLSDQKSELRIRERALLASQRVQVEPVELDEAGASDDEIQRAIAEGKAAEARLAQSVSAESKDATTPTEPRNDKAGSVPSESRPVDATVPAESSPAPKSPEAPKQTLQDMWRDYANKFIRARSEGTPEERAKAREQFDKAFDDMVAGETETVESLDNKFLSLMDEYGSLGENATPEQRRDLELKIREAQLNLREAKMREGAAAEPETESKGQGASDLERFRTEQKDIRQARLRAERQKSLEAVEKAFKENPENHSIIESLELAQKRYTRLKAKSETWGRWGRRTREVELIEAEQSVKQAEITYARLLTDAKVAAGLLNAETPEEQRYLRGEQFFSTQRTLVNSRRYNVGSYRANKIENQGLHMKALAGIGNFFNTGGKWSKGLKAGGIGVVAGVGTALSGAGWPITIPLSTGAGLAFRGASIVDTLNKQAGDIGVEGRDAGIITDEMFEAFMEAYRQSTATQEAHADKFGQDALDAARQQGYLNADRARIEANRVFKRYTIGFAVGSIATVLTSTIWNATHAGASSAPVDAHPNEGTLPNDRYPTINTHVHVPNGGGGEMATKHFLEQNGITGLKENQLLHIWQSQTHGGAVDIFTQNGTGVDTYNMPGPYSGILKAGDFNFTDKVAQAMIEQAKHMPGVVIK